MKVIVLEFNELSPQLMDRFIAEGRLEHFARLKRESFVYITEAEEQPPYLEPWIQWVTIHTGLSYAEHRVFDLGDGAKLDAPRIWDLISRRGGKVWICGSMNAAFREPLNGLFLPDPWSAAVAPYPEGAFTGYFEFVRRMVQEHTRDSIPVDKMTQLRFLVFMAKHGLSFDTLGEIVRQLAAERRSRHRWKRAVLLDSLQWDLFAYYWRRLQPAFSTFFLNSTAHFQHMYWRHMAPELFSAKPSVEDQAAYAGAIRFGYQHMDGIVGRCLRMIDDDTTVVLTSALSQQPCLKYEDTGGKVFYRITDPNQFFAFLGIENCRYAPVMSEQFHLYFADDAAAEDALRKLTSLTMDGRQLMMARRNGTELFAGCQIFERVPRHALVQSPKGAFRFFEYFYDCHLVKSGMHHPDGILWIRPPAGNGSGGPAQRVPLRAVAPTLLAICRCPQPESMKGEPLPLTAESIPV